MTDIETSPTTTDDIETDVETPSDRLTRQADDLLAEGRAFGPRPLRRAVREDAALAGDWGRTRASRLRDNIQEEPIKAAFYALGLGVVIGLLVAR